MSAAEAVLRILGSIWNGFFSLESPFFGLTFKQIFVGFFVVVISIRILWDLLGLGAAAIDTASGIGRRAVGRSRYNRSAKATREYRSQRLAQGRESIRIQNERSSIMKGKK